MADSEGSGRLGDLGKRRSLEDLIKDMVEKDLGPQQGPASTPWDQIVEPLNPEPAPEQTPTPEEQTEPEPEPVQPVVQPVTQAEEPVTEEEQEEKPEVVPLVEPKTPKPTEEIREEAPETPADTYNEWMNYLQEQEALAQEEEQVSANKREPEPEEGYVQPGAGTQKVLGTYPAGTMDYLRENDLDLDWLNSEDGQYWLESQNQPQPEMLFPENVTAPNTDTLPIPLQDMTAINDTGRQYGIDQAIDLANNDLYTGLVQAFMNEGMPFDAASQNAVQWMNDDLKIPYGAAPYVSPKLSDLDLSGLSTLPDLSGFGGVPPRTQPELSDLDLSGFYQPQDISRFWGIAPYVPFYDIPGAENLRGMPDIPARMSELGDFASNAGSKAADITENAVNGALDVVNNIPLVREGKNFASDIPEYVRDIEIRAAAGDYAEDLGYIPGTEDFDRVTAARYNYLKKWGDRENPRQEPERLNELNSPVLSGNDPMAQFADLFETPPADQSQGLNTSPEYLAYLRDNPRLGASSYDEFADRMGNQNAAVPVPRTEPNTAAEDDWRTLIDQWENAEAANNELFRESLEVPRSGDGVTPYTYIAALLNTMESDGWRTEQASDLYGALPRIDPETPGAELLEQQRRERMDALLRQIEADDELRDERPKLTGKDVRDAIDQSQNDTREFTNDLISAARDITAPATEAVVDWVNTDNTEYDTTLQDAQAAAAEAGLFAGTLAYDNFVNNYVQEHTPIPETLEAVAPAPTGYEAYAERVADREYNPGSRDSSAYYASSRDNAIADVMNTGVNGSVAANIVDNPADYTYDETTGRWVRNNTTQTQRGPLSWEDAIGSERLMDDLMQMNAPGLMNEAGDFNTAAKALFMDELTPEQKLHLFDRNGSFFSEGSGVNVDMGDLYADLVANDTMHARRNPELSDTITVTPEQYAAMLDEFFTKNPLIASMYELGQVSEDDIFNYFFKNVQVGQKKGGGTKYGSGYNRGGYGGGGGYRGGYGGSRSYGGYQQNPTAANQTTQRINNIMKNWSF